MAQAPMANTALGAAVLGGRQAELEGQSRRHAHLALRRGVAFLGPLKLSQVRPFIEPAASIAANNINGEARGSSSGLLSTMIFREARRESAR